MKEYIVREDVSFLLLCYNIGLEKDTRSVDVESGTVPYLLGKSYFPVSVKFDINVKDQERYM